MKNKNNTDELRAATTRACEEIMSLIEQDRIDSRIVIKKQLEKIIRPLIEGVISLGGGESESAQDILQVQLSAIINDVLPDSKRRFSSLTPREAEICNLVKQGLTTKEIANKLSRSVWTVFKHREEIRRKLNISNTQISLYAHLNEIDE